MTKCGFFKQYHFYYLWRITKESNKYYVLYYSVYELAKARE